MMRVFFFLMGVPMMIMSFFEAIDVLPLVTNYNLLVNGNVVELTETEMQGLQQQIQTLFEDSHTLPAFGVVTNDMYQEDVKNGYFVSMKFDCPIQINDLPFDELVFKVEKDFHGFNLLRGMNGIFQGRCIYIDLQERNMEELYDYIESLESVKNLNNYQDMEGSQTGEIGTSEEEIDENIDQNQNTNQE